uniref:Uncharacterized protein n=1 Tax=Poecilia latipinna TaxID=48699 RepID=A0A3B3UXW9_9TELE
MAAPEATAAPRLMECRSAAVSFLSWALVVSGAAFLLRQTRRCGQYGRYAEPGGRCWPAGPAWFLQEVPHVLILKMKISTFFFDLQFLLRMIHFLLKSPLVVEEKSTEKPHVSKLKKKVAAYWIISTAHLTI